MEPLDLGKHPPRSCYVELDGLSLLPRTIDKLRAYLPGGNPGGYFINGQIQGLSGYLLERLDVSEEDIRAAIADARSEDDVIAWLRTRTDIQQYAAINATLRSIKIKHTENPDLVRSTYAQTLAIYPEMDRIMDIIDADDRRVFGSIKDE